MLTTRPPESLDPSGRNSSHARRSWSRRRLIVWFCVIAAAFTLTQLARVSGRAGDDARHYVSYSLMLQGESRAEAARHTIEFRCDSARVDVVLQARPGDSEKAYRDCREELTGSARKASSDGSRSGFMSLFSEPRMAEIFAARPGYPLFLVPFIAALGVTWGVWAAAVLLTVAGSACVVAALRTAGVPPPVALAGQVLYYVLPLGGLSMRPMAEGPLLALASAVVLGCARVLHGRPRSGLWIVAAALAAAALVKYSQALLLTLCLLAALAVLVVARWARGGRPPRGLPALLVLSAAAVVAIQSAVRILELPSTEETLQDMATRHFTRPDVADPWLAYIERSTGFWSAWARLHVSEPLLLAFMAAGAWGALSRRRAFGAIVLAVAAAGVVNQIGHPGEPDNFRIIALLWLLPVFGLPLAALRLMAVRPTRHHAEAQPEPSTP